VSGMNSLPWLPPESLIKLIYSLVWAIMVLLPIQRRVYEWVTYLHMHLQGLTICTSQLPSFVSFRHPRYSRKALHRWFCPSASGRHDLALRLGPLERILAPPVNERLLCCWAGLGIHPTFSDLSVVPKPVDTLRLSCSVGVWL